MTALLIAALLIALGWYLLWRVIAWGTEEPLMSQKKARWFQQ